MSHTPFPVVRAQQDRNAEALAQKLRDARHSRKGRRTLRAAVQRHLTDEATAAAVDPEERRREARAKAKRARAARRTNRR